MKLEKDTVKALIIGTVIIILLVVFVYLLRLEDRNQSIQNALREQKRLSTFYDSKFCIKECMDDRLKSLFKSDGQFLGGSSTTSLPMTQGNTLEVIKAQCEQFVNGSKCIKQKWVGYELLEGNK